MNTCQFLTFFICVILSLTSCSKKSDQSPSPSNQAQTQVASSHITINPTDSITATSAICNATIDSDGGNQITERGFCYSISSNPTIANSKINSGAGIGAFTATLINLSSNTTYHFKAYATNSAGTFYSVESQFTTLQSFNIGEAYAGGIIFYIDSTGLHGLIADTVHDNLTAAWSCQVFLNNVNDTAIGTGDGNTLSIISQCNDNTSAAWACDNLISNGYQDWFLPSKGELNIMYLKKGIIGNFENAKYWSSSQYDGAEAWLQNFGTGVVTIYPKNDPQYVRAIRKF